MLVGGGGEQGRHCLLHGDFRQAGVTALCPHRPPAWRRAPGSPPMGHSSGRASRLIPHPEPHPGSVLGCPLWPLWPLWPQSGSVQCGHCGVKVVWGCRRRLVEGREAAPAGLQQQPAPSLLSICPKWSSGPEGEGREWLIRVSTLTAPRLTPEVPVPPQWTPAGQHPSSLPQSSGLTMGPP